MTDRIWALPVYISSTRCHIARVEVSTLGAIRVPGMLHVQGSLMLMKPLGMPRASNGQLDKAFRENLDG